MESGDLIGGCARIDKETEADQNGETDKASENESASESDIAIETACGIENENPIVSVSGSVDESEMTCGNESGFGSEIGDGLGMQIETCCDEIETREEIGDRAMRFAAQRAEVREWRLSDQPVLKPQQKREQVARQKWLVGIQEQQ
jgi:hypothetical protein